MSTGVTDTFILKLTLNQFNNKQFIQVSENATVRHKNTSSNEIRIHI